MSYLNPASPNYRREWWITTHIGMIGGIIMGLAIVHYFVVLIKSLAAARVAESEQPFVIPVSEAYHNEDLSAVRNFRPWVVAAVLLVVVAYYAPLSEIMNSRFKGAPGYSPDSPVSLETK